MKKETGVEVEQAARDNSPTSDEMLRLECLKMANAYQGLVDTTLHAAQKFYDFVKNNKI